MKTRQFIILGVIIVLLGLIYFPIMSTPEIEDKKTPSESVNFVGVQEVNNKIHQNKITSYGQVLPNSQMDVTMKVQGFVEREMKSWKPGMRFKKNEVLFKVERVDALYSIIARRSAFTTLVTNILPDIKLDYPSEFQKWERFLLALDPLQELPPFPISATNKEKLFIASRNLPTEYYNIKAAENQLDNYFYLAPFDGTVVSSFAEPGSMVSPGMRLATIAKTTDFEVKAPIATAQLPLFQRAEFVELTDPNGNLIGTGKLLRTSEVINQQTQSIDAYFSLNASGGESIYQGMFINLVLDIETMENSMILPENAVINGKIQVLEDSLILTKPVNILNRKVDSVYVTGLQNGALILLEPLTTIRDSVKYVGITK
ncbi:MAG: efflux RND transporter periplasmic adaptor subunit [Crocinitomicaceae bacterium]|nr:efflux RND transporter periplasmic adaptor subunit [Crocinitomicaceae bacterium]